MTPRARLIAAIALTTLLGCAAQQQSAGPVGALDGGDDLPFMSPAGEASYHVLMAEIALERGDFEVSASEYRNAAELSDDPQIAERAARVAYDHGRIEDAHAAASRWYVLAPESSYARNMLLSLEVRRGDRDAARRLLDELLDEAEAEGWIGDGIAMAAALLAVDGNWDVALPLMRDTVRRYDTLPEAHLNLATVYLGADEPGRALAPARRAVDLAPDWLRARLLLAKVMLDLGRTEEALAVADAAAALPAADAEFRLRHAMLLVTAGEPARARAVLDVLLEEDPGMVGARRQAGLLAMREGRLDDAREHFRRMLARGDQLTALYLLARTEELRGNLTGAMHLYGQVTGGEYLVPAQVRLAHLLAEFGEGEQGLLNLQRLAERYPEHEPSFVDAEASLLASLDRGDEALAVYDEAIARWPDARSMRFSRAYLLEEMDRVEEAVAAMEALVADYPDSADALNALGYTLADRTDRYREAWRYIRQALRLEPDNPAIIDSMGWVEYRRGRYGRAITHLERAWALLRDPEIAAHLGEVLWMSGRRDEARALWSEALLEFPDDPGLAEVTARFAD
jgi:tetratricopeptide (TPR) repeat protein